MLKQSKYMKNYIGKICQCLETKGMCAHFCKDCLSKLTFELKMELEKPISEGYEEAYDSCVEFLTKKV
jgi:hypothetical protein